MATATKMLSDADAGAKKQMKAAKAVKSSTRFPAGTEWELVHSDAVILHALTLALRYVFFSLKIFSTESLRTASRTWDTFSAFMN